MSKKLMLLAAGALSALAFAALPAVASAAEFKADCKTGATCEATVAGGAASLGNAEGKTISCTSVTGIASLTSGTTTGTASLVFHGCRETITIFKFTCKSIKPIEQPAGTITTGNLTAHLVYLDAAKTKKGISVTNVNVTFTCAGLSDKTVTGNVLGEFTDPNCGNFSKSHTLNFETTAHGSNQWTSWTGNVLDLISNDDKPGETYSTSGQKGEGTLTYTGGNEAKLTC